METDARVRYTKMIIKKKLVELLKDHPLNKITVKELCILAEINRATFYKHYKDPYDLLMKIEEEFLTELTLRIEKARVHTLKDIFLLILKKLQESDGEYQVLFSENGDSKFPMRLFTTCCKEQAARIHQQFPKLSLQEQEFLYYFLAQGCSGIITSWINKGMQEPIDRVADFAERLIENTTHGLQQA